MPPVMVTNLRKHSTLSPDKELTALLQTCPCDNATVMVNNINNNKSTISPIRELTALSQTYHCCTPPVLVNNINNNKIHYLSSQRTDSPLANLPLRHATVMVNNINKNNKIQDFYNQKTDSSLANLPLRHARSYHDQYHIFLISLFLQGKN